MAKLTKCPACHGSGEVMANTLPWSQREEGAFAACPHCKATGFIPLNSQVKS